MPDLIAVLSIADVAERVGVSINCIYLWEADRTRARAEKISWRCAKR